MRLTCDACGKEFVPGNRPDGIPNGVAFVKADGTKVTMCADCIIELGKREAKKA